MVMSSTPLKDHKKLSNETQPPLRQQHSEPFGIGEGAAGICGGHGEIKELLQPEEGGEVVDYGQST